MSIMKTTLLAATAAIVVSMSGCAAVQAPVTVSDTAAQRPELSTLHRLIQEAGLAPTLSTPGTYTVFAPSNEAFKAVPAKTMAELSSNQELLKSVLSYHVVASRLNAADVTNKGVKSLHGSDLTLAKSGDFVTVEDAMVVQADVAASNGVVHIIDRVLMPPKK